MNGDTPVDLSKEFPVLNNFESQISGLAGYYCPMYVMLLMIWVCDDNSCILVSFLVTLDYDIMYIVTLYQNNYYDKSPCHSTISCFHLSEKRLIEKSYEKKRVSKANCSHHHLKADVSSVIFINLLYLLSN